MSTYRKLSCLLLCFTLSAFGQAHKPATLSGIVTTANSEALSEVEVSVQKTFLRTTTDAQGRYQLQLREGKHVLHFRRVGYRARYDTLFVGVNQSLTHEVKLQEELIQFQGVTVEASPYERAPTLTNYVVGQARAKNVPSLGEPDIFKALNLLPGVIQNNDLTGNLHVRGGGADQNLILLEGVEIYNPYHLLGLLGTFNMQAISSAEIFIGDLPAQHGDRISSMINLETLSAPRRPTVNIGLLSTSGVYTKAWRSHFAFLTARRTYLDLLIPQLKYNFTDANFKLALGRDKRLSFETLGFYNLDHLVPDSEEELVAEWGNLMGASRLVWRTAKHMTALLASYTRNFADFQGDPLIDNRIDDAMLKSESLLFWKNHQLGFGLSMKALRFDYEWRGEYNDLKEIFHEGTPEAFTFTRSHRLLTGYASDGVSLGQSVKLEGGVRYLRWQEKDYWSPRFSGRVQLTPRLAAQISVGRYHQALAYGREGIEGSIGSLLFPTSTALYADAATFGVKFSLPNDVRLEIAGYGKLVRKLPGFAENLPALELSSGKILGAEIFLAKPGGALTYQVAYSFLHTRASYGAERYPFDWEAPHALNVLMGSEIAKGWFVNGVLSFHSGTPLTPVVGKFLRILPGSDEQPYQFSEEFYVEGDRNSARLPNYFRFDLSLRKKIFKRTFNYTIYLQALNLLNTKNTLRYDWQDYYNTYTITPEGKREARGSVRALPIIPSLGAEFEF